MTPLQTTLARFLPNTLVLPALALLYALLFFGVIISVATVQPNIYLDVGSTL